MNASIPLRTILRLTITALCCALLVLSGPAAFAQPGNGKGNGQQGKAPQAENGTAPQAGNGTAPQAGNGTAPQAGNRKAPQAENGKAPQAENGKAPQAEQDDSPGPSEQGGAPGKAAHDGPGSQADGLANPGQAQQERAQPRTAPNDAPSGAGSPPPATAPAPPPAGVAAAAQPRGSRPTPPATKAPAASSTPALAPWAKALLAGSDEGAGTAQVSASFTCVSVAASSSKDLSNVVLVFADGSTQRFEGLSGLTGTFAGTGEHAGEQVVAVYVKSGRNLSGDGPGYGERFDSTAQCQAVSGQLDEGLPAPAVATPVNDGAGDEGAVVNLPSPAPSPAADVLGAPDPASPAIAVLSDQLVAPEADALERAFVPAGGPGDVMAVPGTPVPGALAATGTGIVAQLVAGLLLIAGGVCLRRRLARS